MSLSKTWRTMSGFRTAADGGFMSVRAGVIARQNGYGHRFIGAAGAFFWRPRRIVSLQRPISQSISTLGMAFRISSVMEARKISSTSCKRSRTSMPAGFSPGREVVQGFHCEADHISDDPGHRQTAKVRCLSSHHQCVHRGVLGAAVRTVVRPRNVWSRQSISPQLGS